MAAAVPLFSKGSPVDERCQRERLQRVSNRNKFMVDYFSLILYNDLEDLTWEACGRKGFLLYRYVIQICKRTEAGNENAD